MILFCLGCYNNWRMGKGRNEWGRKEEIGGIGEKFLIVNGNEVYEIRYLIVYCVYYDDYVNFGFRFICWMVLFWLLWFEIFK